MNTNEGYNGWSNYQTWCCNLWLTNDATLDSVIHEFIEENSSDFQAGDLADWLSDLVDEMTPQLETSFFSDLLTEAINEIDFYEIAQDYLTD